jgi:ubiquinone biosynthesis protein UbiJ
MVVAMKREILSQRCSRAAGWPPAGDRGPGVDSYNRQMLHTLQQMLAPAVMERVTLLANHLLASEAVGTERLQPHCGKALQIEFDAWPRLLPPLPVLAWRITPAGLLEWVGGEPPGELALVLRLQADNPLGLAARVMGEPPPLDIVGDAQFAADVNWLTENLRWDVGADLERVFPAPLAHALHLAGSAVVRGLRQALGSAAAFGERWRPGGR